MGSTTTCMNHPYFNFHMEKRDTLYINSLPQLYIYKSLIWNDRLGVRDNNYAPVNSSLELKAHMLLSENWTDILARPRILPTKKQRQKELYAWVLWNAPSFNCAYESAVFTFFHLNHSCIFSLSVETK